MQIIKIKKKTSLELLNYFILNNYQFYLTIIFVSLYQMNLNN